MEAEVGECSEIWVMWYMLECETKVEVCNGGGWETGGHVWVCLFVVALVTGYSG